MKREAVSSHKPADYFIASRHRYLNISPANHSLNTFWLNFSCCEFHVPHKRREQLDFGYELFIAAVSILSVFNMLLAYIPGVDAINVVALINVVLTLLFIFDFGLRLATAPIRSQYFFRDYGWADLLAVIPALRIFRLFRIYKAYRIIHKYGIRYILSYLSTNRAASALYILVIMVILIIETGGVHGPAGRTGSHICEYPDCQ